MINNIALLNVGVSDVELYRWKKAGRSVNRIHMPIKGGCLYCGGEEIERMSEGSVYLVKNSFNTDLKLLPDEPYFHFFIDFCTVPLIKGRGLTAIRSDSDPVLRSLLEAVYLSVWEYTRESGCARVERTQTRLLSQVERLLALILERLESCHGVQTVSNEKLELAFSYISENYSRKIKNGDIAEAIGVDERFLSRLFLKYVDMSPYQYLTHCRIERSIAVLKRGGNVAEAAASCGFQSENAFRIAFKKATGCSPTEMAKRL